MVSETDARTDADVCPSCGYENIAGTESCTVCSVSLMEEYLGRTSADAALGIFNEPIANLGPREPVCLGQRARAREAVVLLKGKNIGCVLITADDGGLVGIFTEGDAHYKVAGLIVDLNSIPVESLMTRDPPTLRPDMPISHALHLMGLHGFRHVPLVDDDGAPVGFISFRDICHFMEHHLT